MDCPEKPGLFHYLIELRRRLLYCVATVVVLFGILVFFSNTLYHELALPLLRHLPVGGAMIATAITATFLAPLKLAVLLAILFSIPVILYQLWAFVAPALYQQERRMVWLLLFASTALFYSGVAFAYFVVLPLLFGFFIAVTPPGVTVMPDINLYLDSTCQLFLAFGATFEVPVLTVLLVKTGIVRLETLAAKRPYVIVGAFILGMLLTPPDVVSQTLLAVPLWLLFELGVFLARVF